MSTTKNPLIASMDIDTMNNVGDVLEFLSVAILGLSETQSALSAPVASGMSHVLNCCAKALKGGAE